LIDTILTSGNLSNGEKLIYAFGNITGEHRGLRTVRHGGALGGYRSHFLRFPDQRFSVIILGNFSEFQPGGLAETIAEVYLSGLMKPASDTDENKNETVESPDTGDDKERPADQINLAEFQGNYFSSELMTNYTIYREDGNLFVRAAYNPGLNLKVIKKDVLEGMGISLEFKRGRNGKITGFRLNADRVKNLKFVKR